VAIVEHATVTRGGENHRNAKLQFANCTRPRTPKPACLGAIGCSWAGKLIFGPKNRTSIFASDVIQNRIQNRVEKVLTSSPQQSLVVEWSTPLALP